jgi:hypothetical protein
LVVLCAFISSALIVAICASQNELLLSPETAWRFVLAASIGCILLTGRLTGLGFLRAPIAVLWVIWTFHFGLVAVMAIHADALDDMPVWMSNWLSDTDGIRAAYCGLLFVICYATGACICSIKRRQGAPDRILDHAATAPLRQLAMLSTSAGLALFAVGALYEGIDVLGSAYQDFFEVHNTFSKGVVLIGYGGAVLIASGCPRARFQLWMLFIYLPVAGAVFLSGARSAPVATGAAMLIVAHRTGLRVSRVVAIGCVIGLLTAVSLVSESRAVGIRGLVAGEATLGAYGPMDGLIELGGSLRPVAATLDYVDQYGLFWGGTYFYPFVRQLQLIGGAQRASEFETPRFLAYTINRQYGSIGYSTVAEAYANGGIWGVAIVGFVLGWLVTWLDRRCRTPFDVALLGAVMIPLLMMVRNSFIFVPAWLEIGIVPIVLAKHIALQKRRRVLVMMSTGSQDRNQPWRRSQNAL